VAKNLATNGFNRTGNTFTGWNTNAAGTGTAYTAGQSVTNLSTANGATVTLYAQWAPTGYSSDLKLTDGAFWGPAGSTTPTISFTTGGYDMDITYVTVDKQWTYTGGAEVKYVVKAKSGYIPPTLSEMQAGTSLGSSLGPQAHGRQILLPSTANSNYYVCLMLFRGTEFSAMLVIDAGVVNTWDGTGRFVGIKSSGVVVWSSDKGQSWNEVTTGLESDIWTVAYGGGVFVAISYGEAASSTNGNIWSSTKGSTNNYNSPSMLTVTASS
jgi:hypothetical protein